MFVKYAVLDIRDNFKLKVKKDYWTFIYSCTHHDTLWGLYVYGPLLWYWVAASKSRNRYNCSSKKNEYYNKNFGFETFDK